MYRGMQVGLASETSLVCRLVLASFCCALCQNGIKITRAYEISSEQVGTLNKGEVIEAVETRKQSGQTRVKFKKPGSQYVLPLVPYAPVNANLRVGQVFLHGLVLRRRTRRQLFWMVGWSTK